MEVATIFVLIPAIIWESITPVQASVLFLNLSVAFFILNSTILSFVAGRRLLKSLRQITFDTKLYKVLLFVIFSIFHEVLFLENQVCDRNCSPNGNAYYHFNCIHCHRSYYSPMDLRYAAYPA
jgi:hypothetical protein